MYKDRKASRPKQGYRERVIARLAPLLLLLLAACGPDRDRSPAPPLGPEHYVIAADDVPAAGRHIRYAAPAPGKAGGLDIAITDFAPQDGGPTVSLVGVVHVADPHYFDTLQEELDRYATVLYEGVKPEELSNEEFQRSFTEKGGEAAELQRDLAGWFGFEYQLDAIDYGRKNFVHADMSMEDFLAEGGAEFIPQVREKAEAAAKAEKAASDDDAEDDDTEDDDGETDATPSEPAATVEKVGAVGTDIRSTWQAVKKFGDLALGVPGPLRSLARKMFAETMGTSDIGRVLEMRPGFSELILIRRNEVVIERLKEVLPEAQGSIAIFYGAAHMDDLEERLGAMGYTRTGGRWLRAWAIRPPLR